MTQLDTGKITSPEIVYTQYSNNDLNWGIVVTTAGFQEIAPHSAYPTSNHPANYIFNSGTGRILDEYQLVYVTKGAGVFQTKNKEEEHIGEGMLFILFPGEWHNYRPAENCGWNTYWAGFKGDYADNLLRHHFIRKSHPIYKIGFNEELVSLFREIIYQAKKEEPGFQSLLGGIVIHILGLITKLKKNGNFEDKTIAQKINKARLLMREQVSGWVIPENIAQELNMSYSWFRRTFKQYTGTAPAQYIIQLKTQKAKELLGRTNDPIKQVAAILGFESDYYFSVFFKRQTGMTPGEYRKMYTGGTRDFL